MRAIYFCAKWGDLLLCQMGRFTLVPNGAIYSSTKWGDLFMCQKGDLFLCQLRRYPDHGQVASHASFA